MYGFNGEGEEMKITPFKNYTTGIAVEKTIMEIEHILAKHKAVRIIKDYDETGEINTLSFGILVKIAGNMQVMPVQLPANAEKVHQVILQMQRSGEITNLSKFKTLEHARRVAWRNIRDWLLAQMALVRAEQAEIPQIFLPYAYSDKLGKTFFEMVEAGRVDVPMLEGGSG